MNEQRPTICADKKGDGNGSPMGREPWSKLAILHRVMMPSSIELLFSFAEAEDGRLGSEPERTTPLGFTEDQFLNQSAVHVANRDAERFDGQHDAKRPETQFPGAVQIAKPQLFSCRERNENG